MSEAPMNREQQIKFMESAAKRRAERHERWASDERFLEVLREPAEFRDHASSYSYSQRFVALKTA